MKQVIPGKTFLLGEYAALQGFPAILLTTKPCFVAVSGAGTSDKSRNHSFQRIHPASPAGQLLATMPQQIQLRFEDPYQGMGGLGASSAQFLAAYRLMCQVEKRPFDLAEMLDTYRSIDVAAAESKPSGYDVLAQTSSKCVYVHAPSLTVRSFAWPFSGLTFILLHTQNKCATHIHLNALSNLAEDLSVLGDLVDLGWQACLNHVESEWINIIEAYQSALQAKGWLHPHSALVMSQLKNYPGVKAMKGCGALGADVIAMFVEREALFACLCQLREHHWKVIATEEALFE